MSLRDDLDPQRLRKLHVQFGVREIAAQLDVSTNTVYRAFKRHGIAIADHDVEYHKPALSLLLTHESLEAELYEEDLTVAQIAARYDCSVQTVYNYLDDFEIEVPERGPRTRRPDGFTVDNVRDLYERKGLSIRETADRVGVSSKALRDFMERNDIDRRDYSRTLDPVVVSREYEEGATLEALAERYDCSVATITAQLDATGTPRRRAVRRKPVLDEAAVIAGYKAGATMEELAVEHGCGPRTISALLKENNVPRNGRSKKAA